VIAAVDGPAASAASGRNAARAVLVARDRKVLEAQADLALVADLVPAVRVVPVVIVVAVAGLVSAARAGMTVAVRVAKSARHRNRCPR